MASNQSGFSQTIPGPKVRVVAKIRRFSDPDTNFETSRTVDWVSLNTENSGQVTISFKQQSSSRYSVDYCYNEHEDNELIYSKEVKHLVSAAFEGLNSTVIAHGARGSGKTQLIQGSLQKSGLAMLAISEFLSVAERNGKSIAVSFYEVDHQDHAADLLNPEQPPILVLEDHGRIQFKGLTQTPVKSITEFQNLYITAHSAHTVTPKKGFERACRSHLGLIVHVFAHNESVDGLVSKMNFVDMAGYEDARRKSGDASGVAENNKINKSIYALLNVCHALSVNESRVPFRESKLTRMLQDSLRGTSKILLVSCLNPSFCQDTVYMLSLASRSCQRSHRTPFGSTMKTASSTRQTVTLDSTKKSATSARQTVTLDPTKKSGSSARQIVTLDSTKKNVNSARQIVNSDSMKRSDSSVRQIVASDSSKKSASSVRHTVTLDDSTKKSASPIRQAVTLDSTKKKSASSVRQTVTLDSIKKNASSVRQTVTLDSTKKTASSAKQTLASVSMKKSASSTLHLVTIRKNKIPKSVSASTKKLPCFLSHIYEETCVAPKKSEIQGRKLFDEVSHSAAKAEKEISIANATEASEPLLEISIANVTNTSQPLLVDSSLNASSEVEFDPIIKKGTSFEDKEDIHVPYIVNYSKDLSIVEKVCASNEVAFDPIVEKGTSFEDIHVPYIVNYSKDLSIANEGHNMNKENNNLMENEDCSPPISSQLRELQSLVSSTPLCMRLPEEKFISLDDDEISTKIAEPRTPDFERRDVMNTKSPWEIFNMHGSGMNSTDVTEPRTPDIVIRDVMNTKSPWETFNIHGSGMKNSLVKDYLRILNTAEKDELKKLKGIGEKRANYILELREESLEPFKSLDDLKDIGLSEKQIKGMMKKEVGELFN